MKNVIYCLLAVSIILLILPLQALAGNPQHPLFTTAQMHEYICGLGIGGFSMGCAYFFIEESPNKETFTNVLFGTILTGGLLLLGVEIFSLFAWIFR